MEARRQSEEKRAGRLARRCAIRSGEGSRSGLVRQAFLRPDASLATECDAKGAVSE